MFQLEFSSLPIRPQRRALSWAIGRVIDRGHPKLCLPKTLHTLDPEQRRVYVPGLRPRSTKKLRVRALAAGILGRARAAEEIAGTDWAHVHGRALTSQGADALRAQHHVLHNDTRRRGT